MIGLGVAADLAQQVFYFSRDGIFLATGDDQLRRALAAAPEDPSPPIPADRCPECLALKSVAAPYCRRCRRRLEARERRNSDPARCVRFKGRPCSRCHLTPARGKSGLCRRCYEREWNRKWVRARRLRRVCLALAGMGFNELLGGILSEPPDPLALEAARKVFSAVAVGRAWIARSPWPSRVARGTIARSGQKGDEHDLARAG